MRYTDINIKKILNDPYFGVRQTYGYFNGNVPYITHEPTLDEYGLDENIEQQLQERQKAIKRKYSKWLWILYAIGYSVVAYLYWHYNITIFDSKVFGALVGPLFSYGYMAPVLSFVFLGNTYDKFIKNKIQNDELNRQYRQYTDKLEAYNYWKELGKLNYWMSLDGHSFEEAVAAVFRKQGYRATVSKQGGDGGIDIILTKGSEKIAVQCKAHKKEVGPSAVRELYGTMQHFRFTEGILVSRSGFTKGVYDFAKDKPIKLYNLNNIMKMFY